MQEHAILQWTTHFVRLQENIGDCIIAFVWCHRNSSIDVHNGRIENVGVNLQAAS